MFQKYKDQLLYINEMMTTSDERAVRSWAKTNTLNWLEPGGKGDNFCIPCPYN
jgi:hypothetical protein